MMLVYAKVPCELDVGVAGMDVVVGCREGREEEYPPHGFVATRIAGQRAAMR